MSYAVGATRSRASFGSTASFSNSQRGGGSIPIIPASSPVRSCSTATEMIAGAPTAVVALDIGGTKIASAIGEAGGELRRWRTLPTEAERGAERVLKSAIALANEVLCEEMENGGEVGAIGISTMGLTHGDHVDLAPNVPGWGDLAIPGPSRGLFPRCRRRSETT